MPSHLAWRKPALTFSKNIAVCEVSSNKFSPSVKKIIARSVSKFFWKNINRLQQCRACVALPAVFNLQIVNRIIFNARQRTHNFRRFVESYHANFISRRKFRALQMILSGTTWKGSDTFIFCPAFITKKFSLHSAALKLNALAQNTMTITKILKSINASNF